MQTIRCEHIVIEDFEQRGAGYCRNRGIERSANSDFTIFLDADDTIAPTFVERCLDVWQPGSYVYTDWLEGEIRKNAPERPWRADGSWHVITALIPTQAVITIDGFDENVIGGEDSISYWSLTRAGCCGIHLAEPLFHYGSEGQRAKAFVEDEFAYKRWKELILGRFKYQMGCCGDNTDKMPDEPSNEPQPGDILARAIWAGNRTEYGLATRRQYPRTGNGKQLWVNPLDVQAAPHLWQPVIEAAPEPKRLNIPPVNGATEAPNAVPVVHGVREISRALFPNAQEPPNIAAMAAIEPVGRGDVGQVLRLARR